MFDLKKYEQPDGLKDIDKLLEGYYDDNSENISLTQDKELDKINETLKKRLLKQIYGVNKNELNELLNNAPKDPNSNTYTISSHNMEKIRSSIVSFSKTIESLEAQLTLVKMLNASQLNKIIFLKRCIQETEFRNFLHLKQYHPEIKNIHEMRVFYHNNFMQWLIQRKERPKKDGHKKQNVDVKMEDID